MYLDSVRLPKFFPNLLVPLGGLALSLLTSPVGAGPAVESATPSVYALLINGGGVRARNYQSHFLHIRELVPLLIENGVPRENIVVFASDGRNSAPDLAVRDVQPQSEFWLIKDVWPGTVLGNRIRFENTTLDGVLLRPATKAALRLWFERRFDRFVSGDTLFLYVTDHGSKNPEDPSNNRIVLWGEDLSVEELRELLAFLDPGVSVVTLMSQCFSGSFAHLMTGPLASEEPVGNVCGFFSATAERPAYGCYPENRGKEQVGHSFRFIEALERAGGFVEAHERVLLTDKTPDVPQRTSDVYLEQLLDREARKGARSLEELVDDLLEEAWADTVRYRDDIEVLDRVADTFGSGRPRRLGDLDEEERVLRSMGRRLQTYAPRWKEALDELKRLNVERFLAVRPSWKERLAPELVKGITPREQHVLSEYFLEGLVEFTDADPEIADRLDLLRRKAEAAQAAFYRVEVRLGTLLRMRTLLLRIAGRVYLGHYGVGDQQTAFARVVRCEDVSPTFDRPARRTRTRDTVLPSPFPPLPGDVVLVESLEPGWLGVGFRSQDAGGLGAVRVTTVHTGSPAEAAGIEIGDSVVGAVGGERFADLQAFREWVMLTPVGEERRLELHRDGSSRAVTVRIAAYPLD